MSTKVAAILDMSGSMQRLVTDTLGGYNSFIESLRAEDVQVTLVLFDNEYQVEYENFPITEVPELTSDVYTPRGSTALLDAIGRTVVSLGEQDRAVVLVITDGYENSSVEYKKKDIQKLIEDRPNWEFQFFGADMTSIGDAQSLGMQVNQYTADGVGTRSAYLTMSNIVSNYLVDNKE